MSRQVAIAPPNTSFRKVGFRVFSQWDEDGIIQYVITHIPVQNRTFIEFGVEDYEESNTRFLLLNDHWSGMVLDACESDIRFIQTDRTYWKCDLQAKCAWITRENIDSLLCEAGFSEDVGLLSIDVDGNDYWIWEAIQSIRPRIVIVEYNSVFGMQPISIPYKDTFRRLSAHYSGLYYGCSLAALYHLAKKKGYILAGSNISGNNAFFIRSDVAGEFKGLEPEEAYVLSKYRESRDPAGNLTYVRGEDRMKLIEDLLVTNVVTGQEGLLKEFHRRNDRTEIGPRSTLNCLKGLEQTEVKTAYGGKNALLGSNRSGVSMQVGINCLAVAPSFVGGVNTYVLGLLEGFASAGNGCRFRIFVTEGNQHLFEQFRKRDKFEIVVIGDRLFSLRSKICRAVSVSCGSGLYKFTNDRVFENIRELMESESDVVYTPTPVLPYFNSRRPTVLTMHDIQHVHYPEFFSWPRRLSRSTTYGLSARHVSILQANSQYTKEDLLSHFHWLSPEQVEVIPSGVLVEKFAAPAAADSLSERCGLPDRFLFFPAQLWPHKNHLTVLKALKQIETGHGVKIPLVLTGEKYSAAPRISKFIEEQSMGYVRHVGKVSFQDMVALYQKAAFMITATLHESTSLPILEAAAAGTPIIGSRIPPIEELGRVLQLNLFDPLDVDGLARLIFSLWNDGKTASAQAAHNREHIGFYSWENTARKYVRLFERIVSS